MTTSAGSRLAPTGYIPDEVAHRRLIAQWMREAHQGHLGNTGNVTLAVSTVSTTVADARVGAFSVIGLMPTTANAAAELGAGTVWVSTRAKGFFALTHASTTTADRAFAYSILG